MRIPKKSPITDRTTKRSAPQLELLPVPPPDATRICASCRHWREPGYEKQRDGSYGPGKWHRCDRLVCLTKRPRRPGFDRGDVLAEAKAIKLSGDGAEWDLLHTAPLFWCGLWEEGGSEAEEPQRGGLVAAVKDGWKGDSAA